jgi:hypothetical protein
MYFSYLHKQGQFIQLTYYAMGWIMKKNGFNFWQKQIFLPSPLCIGAALGFLLQGFRKHKKLPPTSIYCCIQKYTQLYFTP